MVCPDVNCAAMTAGGVDSDDVPSVDRDRPGRQHTASRIHGDNDAPGHDERDRPLPPAWAQTTPVNRTKSAHTRRNIDRDCIVVGSLQSAVGSPSVGSPVGSPVAVQSAVPRQSQSAVPVGSPSAVPVGSPSRQS